MSARDWVAKRLSEMDNTIAIVPILEHYISIERKQYPSFVSAVISENVVGSEALVSLESPPEKLQFVCNLPKFGVWTGEAIEAAKNGNLGWGGMGELMSVVGREEVAGFQRKEYDFVERGLRQHLAIERLVRRYDRVFEAVRCGMRPLVIVLVNEYDLSAEGVRHAKDTYGEFDLILKSNPNGKITDHATDAAKEIGVAIFTWGQLLGRLNTE